MELATKDRICLVCRDPLRSSEPTTICPKCKLAYHVRPGRDCWGEMDGKCVNQICAWEGKICPVDQTAVHEGQATALCKACGTIYHSRCWNPARGCMRMGCGGDAPVLRTTEKPVVVTRLRPVARDSRWPCGHLRTADTSRCWTCEPGAAANPGPSESSPGCNGIGCGTAFFVAGLFVIAKAMEGTKPGGVGLAVLAAVSVAVGVLVALRVRKVDAMKRARARPEPPAPDQARTFLDRCLRRLAEGDRLGAEADAAAAASIRPQSCEAVLLRSLARYPRNVEGSYLDFAKAREMEPGTLEGYALSWSLEILYAHLGLVLQSGNVGAQFRMAQTSLTLGAEALFTRDFDLAERCFRSVLDFRSDAVLAAVGLALVRFWRGEEEAAALDLASLRIRNERFRRFVEALRAGPGPDDAPSSDPKKG